MYKGPCVSRAAASEHVANLVVLKMVSDGILSTHFSYEELVLTYFHVFYSVCLSFSMNPLFESVTHILIEL